MAKYIYNLDISTAQLGTSAETRSFTIRGEIGATAMLQVISSDAPTKFYNFKTGTYTTSFTSENNLFVVLENNFYYGNLYFPEAPGVDYTVMLMQDPRYSDTMFKTSGSSKETKSIIKKIEGLSDSTVTFALSTDSYSSNYQSFPSNITSTGNPSTSTGIDVDINWTVNNVDNDTHGFGFKYVNPNYTGINKKDIANTYYTKYIFYFQTTEAVVGDTSSSTSVVVGDLTDLVVGMELKYTTGTTPPASATTITDIDTDTKTLTLSTALSLSDGNTMTFRAYGADLINAATGMNITLAKTGTAFAQRIQTLVRADGGITEATDGLSTTIAVAGTYGIGGGREVLYDGVGVDNSAANAIDVVTANSTAGSFTVQLNQNLTEKTKLSIYNSFADITFDTSVTINSYPLSNKTIYFDLDKLLTAHVSGA